MRSFLLLIALTFTSVWSAEPVRLGIDVLASDDFAALKGKRIGLVADPASVDSSLTSTVDLFSKTDRCKLVALFGPEHGVYGDEYAGVDIPNRIDSRTGLPIYSLYGETRKPTHEMLANLDMLVFDLQDIGSRSYTYISTMKLCLEACAQADIDFVVLDRPNPLGGERIEGPGVERAFESFVSAINVPYLHGMTMGELAQMVKEDIAPHYQKLRIIQMTGWSRSMTWQDTGLRWVPTSPHIPYASSCAAYAATGILGELGGISNGVGYPLPFDLIAAPWIKSDKLLKQLKKTFDAAEIGILPMRFRPFYGELKDKNCEGVQIFLDPHQTKNLIEINFRALEALGIQKVVQLSPKDHIEMFDKVCGSDAPRKWMEDGRPLSELFHAWKESAESFRNFRRKFLLYDDTPQEAPEGNSVQPPSAVKTR